MRELTATELGHVTGGIQVGRAAAVLLLARAGWEDPDAPPAPFCGPGAVPLYVRSRNLWICFPLPPS